MKYSAWKDMITKDDADGIDDRAFGGQSTSGKKDFLKKMLEVFEAENKNFENIDVPFSTDVNVFEEQINSDAINDKLFDKIHEKEGITSKTCKSSPYYKNLTEGMARCKFFQSVTNMGSKSFDQVSKSILNEIKKNKHILTMQDSEGRTILMTLINKLELCTEGKDKKLFGKLTELINQIIKSYGPHLALQLGDRTYNTALHHIFWYASEAKTKNNASELKTLSEIGKKLLATVTDYKVYSELSTCENRQKETIQAMVDKVDPSIYTEFQTRFEGRNIFEAIEKRSLKGVIRFLNNKDDKEVVNSKVKIFDSTPLMSVIVEMGKLYEQKRALKPQVIIEQLNLFKEMAEEIIKRNPNLTQIDYKKNTVFHRLFYYANTLSKTKTEANVFLDIAKLLLDKLTPEEFQSITEQKNDHEETCLRNLYGKPPQDEHKGSSFWIKPNEIQLHNQTVLTPIIRKLYFKELEHRLKTDVLKSKDNVQDILSNMTSALKSMLKKADLIKGLRNDKFDKGIIKSLENILSKKYSVISGCSNIDELMTKTHPFIQAAYKKLLEKSELKESKQTTPQKVTGRFYDMDHCLLAFIREFFEENDRRKVMKQQELSLREWFLTYHKAFLDQEIEKIKAGGFDKVVLGYFTNRQSFAIDFLNANLGSVTCAPILLFIQDYYQEKLGKDVEVVMDPFLMADIAGNPNNGGGNKKAGDSYKLMLEHYYNEDKPIDQKLHAGWMFDRDKLTLVYTLLHRLVTLNKGAEQYHAQFVDDGIAYLVKPLELIKKYPDLFVECNIDFVQYAGIIDKLQCLGSVKSTGEVDENYEWSIRYFYLLYNRALSAYLSSHVLDEDIMQCIEDKDLVKAHTLNQLCNPVNAGHEQSQDSIEKRLRPDGSIRPIELIRELKLDENIYRKFKKDRETIKELTQGFSTLGDLSNYTTFKQLVEDGYISEKSLILLGCKSLLTSQDILSPMSPSLDGSTVPAPMGSFSQSSHTLFGGQSQQTPRALEPFTLSSTSQSTSSSLASTKP